MWEGFGLTGAVRHEMRGFGNTPMPAAGTYSPAEDLLARLDGPSALVGASFGGLVCLDAASRRPDLVTELVLLDAPLPDHEWSEEVQSAWAREDELLEQGELRAASEFSAEFWVSDPSHRARVAEMQERAYELQLESEAEDDLPESIDLAAISARSLVAVGELDKQDLKDVAERLVREITNAESALIEGSGHLPALERQAETSRLVRDFLHI